MGGRGGGPGRRSANVSLWSVRSCNTEQHKVEALRARAHDDPQDTPVLTATNSFSSMCRYREGLKTSVEVMTRHIP